MRKIIPFLVILIMLTGCHASREVQKSSSSISKETNIEIQKHRTDSINTNIVKHDSSFSKTTESVDSTMVIPYKDLVWDKSAAPGPGGSVIVPIKFKRETETKNYNNQVEQKKEGSVTDVKKVVVESSKTISVSKNTETKGQPWAMWLTIGGIVVVVLLILAFFLAKKFKWFI